MSTDFVIDRPVLLNASLTGVERASFRLWLAAGALLLVTLLAYFPVAGAGFIWDDDYYVYKNIALRSAKGLWAIWAQPFHPVTPQYYPLTFTTFWVEYHLWGTRPLGYHVVNVVLHTINSLVLWRLLRKLQIPGAWLAAAVFALHPVHVESVAWVSERKNVLSGLLFLLSLTTYLRWLGLTGPAVHVTGATGRSPTVSSRGRYLLALAFFVLALFSKTVASSLPAVVLLILYWKRGRASWRDVIPLTPFFAIGLSLGSLTSWLERHVVGADGPEWHFSIQQRALIAGRAIWFYAQKLALPSRLTFIYPRWDINRRSAALFAFAIAAVAVPFGLWLLRKRLGRGPLAAVLFFGGCLFPAVGFVNVYPMRFSFVADHFQYLGSIGLIVLGIGGAAWLLHRFAPDQRSMGPIVGAGLLVMLLVATFLRTGDFRSAKLLWTDTIAKNPRAWMAYNNLAILLMREKDYDGARRALDSALAIEPHYAYSRLNRVILNVLVNSNPSLAVKEDPAAAIEEARKALADVAGDQSFLGRTEQATSWKVIGIILFERHDDPAAEDALRHLLALQPNDVDARRDLARVLEHRNDVEAALAQWAQIIKLNPSNAQAHAHSALLLARTSRAGDAPAELALAQKLDVRYGNYTLTTKLQP